MANHIKISELEEIQGTELKNLDKALWLIVSSANKSYKLKLEDVVKRLGIEKVENDIIVDNQKLGWK